MERGLRRQELAVPVMAQLDAWRADRRGKLRPKSKLGEAWTYLDNQWDSFQPYLRDGRLHIDNNWVENHIRPIAVGRKNYLFCGSDAGARRAAAIYTVLAVCRVHAVDPWAYLSDVLVELARLQAAGATDYRQMLPDAWKARKAAGGQSKIDGS